MSAHGEMDPGRLAQARETLAKLERGGIAFQDELLNMADQAGLQLVISQQDRTWALEGPGLVPLPGRAYAPASEVLGRLHAVLE